MLVEWQLAFIGNEEPGATLPFLIKDKTPRSYRVKPSQSVSSGDLVGITHVVLCVRDLDDVIALFQKVYGWKEPARSVQLSGIFKGAELATFENSPVVIASPKRAEGSWLSKRLEQFGDSPCSFLITASLAFTGTRTLQLDRTSGVDRGREKRRVDSELKVGRN